MNLEKISDLIKVTKALSVPQRVRILKMILQKPMYVQEIAEDMKMPYALAHLHLKALEEAGILKAEYIEIKEPKPHKRKMYYAKDFEIIINNQVIMGLKDER